MTSRVLNLWDWKNLYERLNKEAAAESKKVPKEQRNQIWFWSSFHMWEASEIVGFDHLYVVSNTKPNWTPDLIVQKAVDLHFDKTKSHRIWRLDLDQWVEVVGVEPEKLDKQFVYLCSKYKPEYHPLQTEIAKFRLEGVQNVAPAPKQPEAKHSWHNTNEWKLDTTVTSQQLLNYVNATDKKEAQKWSLLVDLTKFLNSLQEAK